MKTLIDVVNFNADASCLSSSAWHEALRGGADSDVCRWLMAAVDTGRKLSLGLTGATVADLVHANPEAVSVIRDHRDIFELLVRPFAHDVALLRSPGGFRYNLALGQRVLGHTFGDDITPAYLPPEFMLTNEQLGLLAEAGILATFINRSRFRSDLAANIPETPYVVEGLFGAALPCLPLSGALTHAQRDALHEFTAAPWNEAIARTETDLVASWRDGESAFFLPDGVDRERAWLEHEAGARRCHVRDVMGELVDAQHRAGYPLHAVGDWMKELRMLGYLRRIERLEDRWVELSHDQRILWLSAIGSDVLSAVEKEPPQIEYRQTGDGPLEGLCLQRSARGLEGEEALVWAERLFDRQQEFAFDAWLAGDAPHLFKLRARRKVAIQS